MSTILLVEDDPNLRQLVGEILMFSDYHVTTVIDSQAALAFLRASPTLPDVILSDLLMPSGSGIELFEALRSECQWSRIPLVLLSSKAHLGAFGLELPYELDGYVSKPFTIKELLSSLQQALVMSRSDEHHQQPGTRTTPRLA